jgi:hypothetical protein
MSTEQENKDLTSNDAKPMLAEVIIKAVINKDWQTMLSFVPDGIEYRASIYKKEEDFTEWETYEDFARYIEPARDKLINICLTKALELVVK